MGLLDFLPSHSKGGDKKSNDAPVGSTSRSEPRSGHFTDVPPPYYAVPGSGAVRSAIGNDARNALIHLEDAGDSAIWSCRGCGVSNDSIRHKCLQCPNYSLCHRCLPFSTTHHPRHAIHNFALVTLSEGIWKCDSCGERDGPLRAKCRSCPDYDICQNCANNLETTHSVHPSSEDFTWTLYSDAVWQCDGCGTKNGDLAFKCRSCRDMNLCPKCLPTAAMIHPIHPNETDYLAVLSLNRWWRCDSCHTPQEELIRKKRAEVRWDCLKCENVSLCSKCFDKREKKHKKHIPAENFAAVYYIDMCVDDSE